ncbi:MAG: CYTH domain-containing protein [Chromatiales bacterium]|nr:CYTH domain-containing protein [Chromatiales bacterium]
MAIEIERKFLVINDLWQEHVISKSHIKQGYLATQKNATVRIRIAKGKAILNIKSATSGIQRSEFEYEIPMDEAELMLEQVVEHPIIEKIRYKVQGKGHVWDLDEFHGDNEGLVMAEIELLSEDEEFVVPDWAGEEVSSDTRYYNSNLIKHPFKQWNND